MEHKLFVDTWGWLTLRDKREARHKEGVDLFHHFQSEGGSVLTTDYVLDETFTLFFKRLSFPQAKESMELLLHSVKEGTLFLEFITQERFSKTVLLRTRFKDKPQISFTDLSSIVVMEELNISQIFTSDEHFTHVGKGFQIVP
jgi:predicted nucleic acid-binding protein